MNRNLPELENAGRVLLDNDKAIRMGLEHLLANGYRHIEMISNNIQLSTLNIREDSYRQAMSEMGMEQFCRVTFVNEADDNEVDAALSEVVSRGADAIFVPRGYLALYVCKSSETSGHSDSGKARTDGFRRR